MCNAVKGLFDRVRYLGINIEQTKFRIKELREAGTNTAKGPLRENCCQAGRNSESWVERAVVDIVTAEQELQTAIAERERLQAKTRDIIQALSNFDQRQILRLRYIDVFTWSEIASILQFSESYVYKLHKRALKEAENALQPQTEKAAGFTPPPS